MNIEHAENEIFEGDKLAVIFNRQKELMAKYHDIESKSGLVQTEDVPVNLNDMRGQARIKDFSWRVTEELGEALDSVNDYKHYCEELIDGLHFLNELTILTGLDYNSIIECDIDNLENIWVKAEDKFNGKDLNYRVTQFINQIGMMCNCLKNKPWKQSQMLTDIDLFYDRLAKVWISYISIISLNLKP